MWRETKELVANRNFVKLGRTFVSGSGHIKSVSNKNITPRKTLNIASGMI